MRSVVLTTSFSVMLLSCSGGSAAPPPSSQGESIERGTNMAFQLTSGAFAEGQAIPRKHTGEGEDHSPPLAWENPPAGTQEFALVCDDPDAPTPEPWVHWVIYAIPADARSLPEGFANPPQLEKPVAAKQGKNSWPAGVTVGYRGPMPPPGHGTHHYHFTLYALDTRLDLAPSATKAELLRAMKGHVLAEAKLIGTYER